MYKGHAPKRKGRRQSEKFGDRQGGPVAWARSRPAVPTQWGLWAVVSAFREVRYQGCVCLSCPSGAL